MIEGLKKFNNKTFSQSIMKFLRFEIIIKVGSFLSTFD